MTKKKQKKKQKRRDKKNSQQPKNGIEREEKEISRMEARVTSKNETKITLYSKKERKEAKRLQIFQTKYRLLGKEEWWWIFDDTLAEIGCQLEKNNYVVLDNFLSKQLSMTIYNDLKNAHDAGELPETKKKMIGCPPMQLGSLGALAGSTLTYKMNAVRGDYVAWYSGKEGGCNWKGLPVLLQRLDTLVSEIEPYVKGLKGYEKSRSNAMATCYPGGGAKYIRHCDNTTEVKNGRRLTALYYANPYWKDGDGGELRLFKPATVLKGSESATDPMIDVQPILDRVVLFFSDERVPHEVLPAKEKRFALTMWYFDKAERELCLRKGKEQEARVKENERIEKEVKRFQDKFGETAQVYGKIENDAEKMEIQDKGNASLLELPKISNDDAEKMEIQDKGNASILESPETSNDDAEKMENHDKCDNSTLELLKKSNKDAEKIANQDNGNNYLYEEVLSMQISKNQLGSKDTVKVKEKGGGTLATDYSNGSVAASPTLSECEVKPLCFPTVHQKTSAVDDAIWDLD